MLRKYLYSEYESHDDIEVLKLGSGTFGTIYFDTGTAQVYKKCRAIENCDILAAEYRHLKGTHKALSAANNEILSPTPFEFYHSSDDDFWNEVASAFPPSDSTRTCVFSMSRVYPLSIALRQKLVELFCPDKLLDKAKMSLRQGHHVARLFLGRADPDTRRAVSQRFFDTHNFPLTRERAEKLGIDTKKLSEDMGRMLAQMHMAARHDARAIKVILGANITSTLNRYREPRAWVVDFNEVKDFNFTVEEIPLLVDAFFANEAYFPRARSADLLYKAFAEAYCDECQKIGEEAKKLGRQFIVALETEQIHKDNLQLL